MRKLKDYSSKDMEDAEENLQRLSRLKFRMEECLWDVFIEEILPRLSAKNLLQFQTVCKNWYRVIRSPYFVKLHLNVYNQSRIRIFTLNKRGEMMTTFKYNINSDEGETTQIPIPVIRERKFEILGSCDGLLCLFLGNEYYINGYYNKIGLYNPSTGEYCSLQLFPHLNTYVNDFNCSWFGRNPSSGEYVLVLGTLDSDVGIYKFNRSNLQLIHSKYFPIHPHISFSSPERGTLLHGTLHWPSIRYVGNQCRYIICAYHLDDDKYSEISPPIQCKGKFKLGVVEGCLLATFKANVDVFELWIMKEYGIEKSWTKYAEIQGFRNIHVLTLTPLGYFPNGDIILDLEKVQLIKYSLNNNKATPLTDPDYNGWFRHEAIMCANSLVAPTIVVGGVVE